MLVLGENMLVTFLGWEGVGTCSYLLISFWHTRESAATAGKKAFVTNRVGDWGFMLAMFLAFSSVGTLSFDRLNHAAEEGTLAASTATGIAALVFVGAVGKSAQLPLYFWLPDAMEGPTPVSALIHAATMVTAGVFVMTRINPITEVGYDWLPTLIAWVGGITALFAATIAIAQNDIKRVLAYSTVSQLGYMFLAVGTGAYVAAIFHMVTHAFFKALLFLGSGSVIHGMHDEQDMRRMGMLRKLMPITAATFIVGWLAIAGVPPFAGFWSKDEILLFAFAENKVLYVIGLITAVITAYYMTRQVVMVFFGEARWKELDPATARETLAGEPADEGTEAAEPAVAEEPVAAAHDDGHGGFKPHESPAIMLLPLVVLALLSFVGGGVQLPFSTSAERLELWLHPVVEFGEADITDTWAYDNKYLLLVVAIVGAITGIVAAWLVYERKRAKAIEPEILAEGWYYDSTVSKFMGGPGREAFDGIAWADKNIVDGAVNGAASTVKAASGVLRRSENGFVRAYAGVLGIGAVLALVWFVLVEGSSDARDHRVIPDPHRVDRRARGWSIPRRARLPPASGDHQARRAARLGGDWRDERVAPRLLRDR